MASVDYAWACRWNKPRGWRQRVGQQLRRWLDRFDGRHSVAVEIVTTPALTGLEKAQALRAGLQATERLIGEAVLAKAVEEVLRQDCPHLYEKADGR